MNAGLRHHPGVQKSYREPHPVLRAPDCQGQLSTHTTSSYSKGVWAISPVQNSPNALPCGRGGLQGRVSLWAVDLQRRVSYTVRSDQPKHVGQMSPQFQVSSATCSPVGMWSHSKPVVTAGSRLQPPRPQQRLPEASLCDQSFAKSTVPDLPRPSLPASFALFREGLAGATQHSMVFWGDDTSGAGGRGGVSVALWSSPPTNVWEDKDEGHKSASHCSASDFSPPTPAHFPCFSSAVVSGVWVPEDPVAGAPTHQAWGGMGAGGSAANSSCAFSPRSCAPHQGFFSARWKNC